MLFAGGLSRNGLLGTARYPPAGLRPNSVDVLDQTTEELDLRRRQRADRVWVIEVGTQGPVPTPPTGVERQRLQPVPRLGKGSAISTVAGRLLSRKA